MIYLRFSRRRVAAICVLTFVTVWYVSVMAHNATPSGADKVRQEQPLTPTSFRLLPPLRVDNPTLPVNR